MDECPAPFLLTGSDHAVADRHVGRPERVAGELPRPPSAPEVLGPRRVPLRVLVVLNPPPDGAARLLDVERHATPRRAPELRPPDLHAVRHYAPAPGAHGPV